MKSKRQNISTQLLIIVLAALVLGIMLQVAQAQVLQIDMPQKSFWRTVSEKTTLSYYHQFLGPTATGQAGETYNPFQEARINYQSYHAASIRYQLNPSWAWGLSMAGVNAYGKELHQDDGFEGENASHEFFNARAFMTVPSLKLTAGTLFTTVAYEHPTSNISKEYEMQYGAVLMQSFAFALPSPRWNAGVNWQYYRAFFKENIHTIPKDTYFPGSLPIVTLRQTTIFSGGPYVNYYLSERWMWGNSMNFDWDQRGNQTGSYNWNNNLPDRARTGVTYFPKIKNFASVGLFTQALLKYSTDTHAIGGEFALKF